MTSSPPRRYYAGIGSKSTPPEILKLMRQAAMILENQGYILRSGGAKGADQAFEAGVRSPLMKEIYLPWDGFLGRVHNPDQGVFTGPKMDNWSSAMNTVYNYHPCPQALTGVSNGRSYDNRGLMARNAYQVLGQNLRTPVNFIVCWTPGGMGEGGTGQAIRIAKTRDIAVRDLGNPGVLQNFRNWLLG